MNPISRANILGMLFSALGLLVLLCYVLPSLELSWRSWPELSFLEEWWKDGQGKGLRSRTWRESPGTRWEKETLQRLIAERADPLLWNDYEISDLSSFVLAKSEEFKMSPMLVLSLIDVESGFRRAVVSHRGAVGLMQLLPSTAEQVAEGIGMRWSPSLLEDPKINIELGLRYMKQLREQFHHNGLHALTAYNMGPAALRGRLAMGNRVSLVYAQRVMDTFHAYKKRAKLPGGRSSRLWAQAWL